MRRFHRVALAALLIGISTCDQRLCRLRLDKLDVFGLNTKKPLPGERHAVFPGGRARCHARHSL